MKDPHDYFHVEPVDGFGFLDPTQLHVSLAMSEDDHDRRVLFTAHEIWGYWIEYLALLGMDLDVAQNEIWGIHPKQVHLVAMALAHDLNLPLFASESKRKTSVDFEAVLNPIKC